MGKVTIKGIIKKFLVNPIKKRRKKRQKRVRFTIKQVTGQHVKSFPIFARHISFELLLLQKAFAGQKYKRSLDIGCGYGRLSTIIASVSENYCGLEPEKELYQIAKKLHTEHTFVNARADKIPFEDNSFDLIVTWTVLQHIKPEMIEKSINEIKRVASNETTIILAEYTDPTDPSDQRTFGRTIEEYSELMKPYELKDSFDRDVRLDRFSGTVMIFKLNK